MFAGFTSRCTIPLRCVIESTCHFDRPLEGAVERQRSLRDPRREGFPLEVLHDDEVDAVAGADIVQRADVRVRERRAGLGLAIEALAQERIDAVAGRQDLDGDGSIEPRVDRAEHLSHSAFADEPIDLVGTEGGAGRERGRRLDQVRRDIPDRPIHQSSFFLLGQQRLELTAHGGVVAAGLRNERRPDGWLLLEDLLVYARDLFPAFAVHHRHTQVLGRLNVSFPQKAEATVL
jgi:hypothetical protein